MAVFCGKCGQQHGLPMSSVRVSRVPCDYCNGFDQINLTRDGKVVRTQNLPNYSYPTRMMPSTVEREESQELRVE
jgi:hypothetical protein